MESLRMNQNVLFHFYYWVIPLLIPAVIIIAISVYKKLYLLALITLLIQIYLYNVILLSTNIGLLGLKKNAKDKFKEKNIAFSISLLVFCVILFAFSIWNNFSQEIKFDMFIVILFIPALPLTYFSIFLLSKNRGAAFVTTQNTVKLSIEREKEMDIFINKLLNENE